MKHKLNNIQQKLHKLKCKKMKLKINDKIVKVHIIKLLKNKKHNYHKLIQLFKI